MHFQLRRNLPLKVFSLLLAAACWFVVSSEEDHVQDFSAPIDYINLPSTLDLSGKVVDTLAIRLRGSEPALRTLAEDRLQARIDLARAAPGDQTIAITREMVHVPSGVEVVRLTPELVPLRIERLVKRQVPVVAEFAGRPAFGFEKRKHVIDPPTVTIEGPASEVGRVTRATTGTILLEDQTGDYRVEITPIPDAPPGSRVRLAEPARRVRVTISIAADGGSGS